MRSLRVSFLLLFAATCSQAFEGQYIETPRIQRSESAAAHQGPITMAYWNIEKISHLPSKKFTEAQIKVQTEAICKVIHEENPTILLASEIYSHETALKLDPNGIGILFKIRRYEEMIDLAEFAMIDQPDDLLLRSLLALAYNATGKYESAIYVLSTTGLPDAVFKGLRSTNEMTGYGALMNALYGIGQTELARELAHFRVYEFGSPTRTNSTFSLSEACDRAILGEDEEARRSIETTLQSLYLAWDPVLKDAPCFERFADDPVYQATVRYFDDRRAMLRERLPATLAEFGVAL